MPRPIRSAVAHALGFDAADEIYRALQNDPSKAPFLERLLQKLAITYRVSDRDLQHVPRSGPLIVVANHPYGVLEGAVLATALARVRSDTQILANGILSSIPEVTTALIPVDPDSGDLAGNIRGLRRAFAFLKSGGCLVIFPAGEVSHFQIRQRATVDGEWHTAVARIVEVLQRQKVTVSIVPAFVAGSNSSLFQAAGLIHPQLRTALLARELINKRNAQVDLRVGSAISGKKLLEIPSANERTEYLRWRTYVLSNRPEYRTRTREKLRSAHRSKIEVVQAAANPEAVRTEVASLPAEALVARTGDLEVYIAEPVSVPAVLNEIGRLREITFRAVGEGTGKAFDLDRFDAHYLHLFAWNAAKSEIVGAYRLAGTDRTRDLYTATLFRYDEAFLKRMGPALELGRSFIREEYQKSFSPLLALWKGIGAYIARNPRYKIVFGPVSISNQYQAISRELMVTYLEKHASLQGWMNLVRHRNPFRKRSAQTLPAATFDVEELSDVISDLEPARAGVPILLRQYLKLGGKLLGFNVDPEFSDALDGLILVDLTHTEPRLLERYLGKAEASQFLAFQKGHHGT